MTFNVEATTHRTFYIEARHGTYSVIKHWEVGHAPTEADFAFLVTRALTTEPDARIMAEEIEDTTHLYVARARTFFLHPKLDESGYRVGSVCERGASLKLRSGDRSRRLIAEQRSELSADAQGVHMQGSNIRNTADILDVAARALRGQRPVPVPPPVDRTNEPITGRLGTGRAVNLSGARQPNSMLGAWLLHLPKQAIAWEHFCLTLIHLRQLEGGPTPTRSYPEAEFEMALYAVDSEGKPNADDVQSLTFMTPVNYRAQFHGLSDAKAREVTWLMARAFCDGYLPAEPMRTTVSPPPPRPGGLIIPGDSTAPVVNIGDGDKLIQYGDREYTAREMFALMVRNTVEHAHTGGKHEHV